MKQNILDSIQSVLITSMNWSSAFRDYVRRNTYIVYV
jgi:hypothetical protein